jgi:hypothetical protein
VPIPGQPDRQYFAYVNDTTRVTEMSLELVDQDCYR